jgi:hypothetical protein
LQLCMKSAKFALFTLHFAVSGIGPWWGITTKPIAHFTWAPDHRELRVKIPKTIINKWKIDHLLTSQQNNVIFEKNRKNFAIWIGAFKCWLDILKCLDLRTFTSNFKNWKQPRVGREILRRYQWLLPSAVLVLTGLTHSELIANDMRHN